MKKHVTLITLFFVIICVLVGCKKKDDTSLWNAMWRETTQANARLNNLESKCKDLNDNVDALQAIVDALEKNEKILAFTEVKDGYVITFGDGKTVTIHNNGTTSVGNSSSSEGGNSQEHTPIVSVTKDEDGNYYWTVDGEIIKDANGDKIPVNDINNGGTTQSGVTPRFKIENGDWYVSYDDGNTYTYVGKATGDNGTGTAGQDGVTPRFKIENGDWYVSYDDGNTYTYVGKATGDNGTGTAGQDGVTPRFKIENGDWYVSYDDGNTYTYVGKATGDKGDNGTNAECVFKSVTQDANNVYFTLADDTVITIAKAGSGSGASVVIDNGALPGVFSVSDSKKVRFSMGNLNYKPSTGIWYFDSNQWGYRGTYNSYISDETYTGWIDLFGYGTSGFNGMNPCMASTTSSTDYPLVDISGTNYDWGVYNAISNGGNQPGLWRTLTKDEWIYLFEGRANCEKKYGWVEIANRYVGIVVLPDSWVQPDICLFTPGLPYSNNKYTLVEWKAMEAAGAVFLPASGKRNGTSVSYTGEQGFYWSSSFNREYSDFYIRFSASGIDFDPSDDSGTTNRSYNGRSVRLVQDVE